MCKYIRLFLLLCIVQYSLNAQQVRPDDGYLFDQTIVPKIEVYLSQDSLDTMLLPTNVRSNHEYRAMCIITKGDTKDTINNIGLRLRGNTSRLADKKSFKISFNSFEPEKKFKGLEKLNLNGEHNDPSIVRAKLAWDFFADAEIPAARVNHVRLHINDEYRGLYLNVEHIDEEFIKKRFENTDGNLFKCLWPANLNYINSDPESYKFTNNGRRAYDLKTNTVEDDYSGLADFIWRLNSSVTNNFQCKIEEVLDVNSVLKAMAIDMLTSNWDGVINQNNFYLYEDLNTGKFHWLPYDTDNTFGIDWFGIDWASVDIYQYANRLGSDRPLYEQMLTLPEYRAKYTYYVDQLIQSYYNNSVLDPVLDDVNSMTTPFRIPDTYATEDYNWSITDFSNSFGDFDDAHVKYGLKSFITKRKSKALEQLDDYDIVPIMTSLKIVHTESDVQIYTDMIDDLGIESVILHYSIDAAEWNESNMALNDDGHYFATIAINTPGFLQYYIKVTDSSNQSRNFPICGNTEINTGFFPTPNLVINELMASNSVAVTDNNGEYDDWIELYNADNVDIQLSNYYLSDNSENPNKWQLPNIILSPDDYFVIWADEDGSQGDTHANFKLQKSGEQIGIYDNTDNNFALLDYIEFGAQNTDVSFGRRPNGVGEFEVLDFYSPKANNDINTEVKEVSSLNLSIYPNPTSIEIRIDEKYIGQRYNIANTHGKILTSAIYDEAINIKQLPSGLYYISIVGGGVISIDKFIIVR